MKAQKHKAAKKDKALSVKDIKVCFGKCRCFSAAKNNKYKLGR
jgi:hypothetical protein